MNPKTRVGSGIGIPDQSFWIAWIDAQSMWVVSTFPGSFGATVDIKLFRFEIESSHLATGAHRGPQAAVIGRLN